MSILFKV